MFVNKNGEKERLFSYRILITLKGCSVLEYTAHHQPADGHTIGR
jgi:hypothetical protein